jgi:MerC mercury resistance protein
MAEFHQHPERPDFIGTVLSAVCAVHCLLTPLIPAASSALGGFHPVLLVGVVGVALWAFVPGFKCHRSLLVLGLALAGIGFLSVAALLFHGAPTVDAGLSMTGAALMMLAHWHNRKLLKHAPAV